MKKKKYTIFVSDCYYILKDGVCEWATEIDPSVPEFKSKKVEEHGTVEACFQSMNDWGSRWVMYPSVIIEDSEGSEVYSSIPCLDKCPTCKKEEWDTVTSDMRKMKDKDGLPLFPDII